MEAPDENFGTYPRYDATGIVNYVSEYHEDLYPYPWHLFAMLERGGGSTAVYYDTYTRQGILEGGFYSISLQPVAQAGLHKPYPAGTVSTEGTGVDANQTINWFYDSLPAGFDMDSYYDAIDSQKQEYPKCYMGTDGQPITDFSQYVVRDAGGGEIKEWYALAAYLQHFGADGLPDQYAQPDGRKDVSRSWNPVELVRSPGWPTFLALAALLLILAGAALLIRRIVRRRRRRRRGW